MKMKPLILFVCALLGRYSLMAQQTMTKEEILVAWKLDEARKDTVKRIKNITFEPAINQKISLFVDSLKEKGVDSLIIYAIWYPGYITDRPCFERMYILDVYILWPSGKTVQVKMIEGRCESMFSNAGLADVFNYCNTYQETIWQEFVMPVISGAERLGDSKISYTMHFVSHEPNYSLYLVLGPSFKAIQFTENDMQNEESLFHQYNSDLKSTGLWKLVDRGVKNRTN